MSETKFVLYGNGSSGNHGCEAIYRGTGALLAERFMIQSENIAEDQKYGVDQIADLHKAIDGKPGLFDSIQAYAKLKISKNFTDMDGIRYLSSIKEIKKNASIAMSVGGDNYCYGYPDLYAYLNRAYHKAGLKTVLWGCSVEPELTKDIRVVKDLKTYDLIVARESITYEAIKSIGANIVYCPDPAFFMKPQEIEINDIFRNDTVGINCSPMIISNETKDGIVYQNYAELIRYILSNTNLNIALIPHVVWQNNNDLTILSRLYEEFDKDNRICLVEDHNAQQLKYVISKCKLFVGARTHSTIAAYSSFVPTLVVGYSVKARGIAKDLFGKENSYAVSAQKFNDRTDLTDAFIKLMNHQDEIREQLHKAVGGYADIADQTVAQVKSL